MAKALAIIADEFEELEATAPIDLLRRAGVEVTTAGLNSHQHATGRSGITVHTDTHLGKLGGDLFDLVFLPGGAGVKHLRSDPRVGELVKAHAADGKWIAAICAAPTVLHDLGLLVGKRYTAHFSVASELPEIRAHERVVTDGNLTTSRGAGTAVEFGLHLAGLLTSPAKADEISKAICF